jgi:hypothetical protein
MDFSSDGTSSITTSGTGITTTISELAAGSYTLYHLTELVLHLPQRLAA